MKILTLGDSIFAGSDNGVTFRSALLALDPTLQFSGLYTDATGHLTLAQSGACIHEMAHPGRLYALPDRSELDAVFIMVGINNYRVNDAAATMQRDVGDLVRCLEHDTDAPLYFAELYQPNPQYAPWGNRNPQVLFDYNAHLQLLTARPRVNVVSTAAMRWFMLKDGVHPNPQGFTVLAQAFLEAA